MLFLEHFVGQMLGVIVAPQRFSVPFNLRRTTGFAAGLGG